MQGRDKGAIMKFAELQKAAAPKFKELMREAFQQGYESVFGPCAETILPDKDMDASLNAAHGKAHVALSEAGSILAGAVVSVDAATGHGHLDFLFVTCGMQNKGIGYELWKYIEQAYPNVSVWKTVTPYFDKRNIHFYVNKLHFHIIEFIYNKNKDNEGMFVFEKKMNS